jgi:hypothetical protein
MQTPSPAASAVPSLTLNSLRAGRKIGSTPEIAGLITNNARQIKRLRSRPPAPSGTVLREAGRPLRERAGRESLDMTRRRVSSSHHSVLLWQFPILTIPLLCCKRDCRLRHRRVAIIDRTEPPKQKEAAYRGRLRRLQGGPRRAAVAHPFPKGTVRQPRRPQQKEAACAARRVLGVTALGPDLGGAREHAYTAVDRFAWPEGFCRRDIAAPR